MKKLYAVSDTVGCTKVVSGATAVAHASVLLCGARALSS